MSNANKALVRRFMNAFATNDRAVLEEVLAPDFAIHVPDAPGPLDRATHVAGIGAFASAFSGIEITLEDQIAEGDRVATRLTWRAAHEGEFHGVPATGKRVSVAAMDVVRCREGRIVERWFLLDRMALMQQLGAVPAPGGS